MKISCIQMNVKLGCPAQNFQHAEQLITEAMGSALDVLVLPETWNTGFFPRENLAGLSCRAGAEVKDRIGGLAKRYGVNIVAGSVSNVRNDKVFNTALVFDRAGTCIAEYDKIHLFSPMGEQNFYAGGNRLCSFTLEGVRCGMAICYDLRFPELTRRIALQGAEVLFVSAQWPQERIAHWRALSAAAAIQNQLFAVCCNACGTAGQTLYGGNSVITDPWGNTLALAGENEEIITGDCDMQLPAEVRSRIPVFRDRRPELY